MDTQGSESSREFEAVIGIDFSYFGLFDYLDFPNGVRPLLSSDESGAWFVLSGQGGALFHADDKNLQAHVVLTVSSEEVALPEFHGERYSGQFYCGSGSVILGASVGSSRDITVELGNPGTYRIDAWRLPELSDSEYGDEATVEEWRVFVRPHTS